MFRKPLSPLNSEGMIPSCQQQQSDSSIDENKENGHADIKITLPEAVLDTENSIPKNQQLNLETDLIYFSPVRPPTPRNALKESCIQPDQPFAKPVAPNHGSPTSDVHIDKSRGVIGTEECSQNVMEVDSFNVDQIHPQADVGQTCNKQAELGPQSMEWEAFESNVGEHDKVVVSNDLTFTENQDDVVKFPSDGPYCSYDQPEVVQSSISRTPNITEIPENSTKTTAQEIVEEPRQPSVSPENAKTLIELSAATLPQVYKESLLVPGTTSTNDSSSSSSTTDRSPRLPKSDGSTLLPDPKQNLPLGPDYRPHVFDLSESRLKSVSPLPELNSDQGGVFDNTESDEYVSLGELDDKVDETTEQPDHTFEQAETKAIEEIVILGDENFVKDTNQVEIANSSDYIEDETLTAESVKQANTTVVLEDKNNENSIVPESELEKLVSDKVELALSENVEGLEKVDPTKETLPVKTNGNYSLTKQEAIEIVDSDSVQEVVGKVVQSVVDCVDIAEHSDIDTVLDSNKNTSFVVANDGAADVREGLNNNSENVEQKQWVEEPVKQRESTSLKEPEIEKGCEEAQSPEKEGSEEFKNKNKDQDIQEQGIVANGGISDRENLIRVENNAECQKGVTESKGTTSNQENLTAKKMADLETHTEISNLKLQLNAAQQTIASLELEIHQKEEIIIKTQAEYMKGEQALKNENKQLKEKLKENSKIIEKDEAKDLEQALKEAQAREQKALNALNDRTEAESNYEKKNQYYERLLKEKIIDLQKHKEDHDTTARHLANIEMAFSDVHQKYERTKAVLEGLKSNEEALRQDRQLLIEKNRLNEEKYMALQAHARAQIEKSNKSLMELEEKYDVEFCKLRSIVKRLEIKCTSLETALEQKTKECDELSALCDDLTGKTV